jgi:hypothetical protein
VQHQVHFLEVPPWSVAQWRLHHLESHGKKKEQRTSKIEPITMACGNVISQHIWWFYRLSVVPHSSSSLIRIRLHSFCHFAGLSIYHHLSLNPYPVFLCIFPLPSFTYISMIYPPSHLLPLGDDSPNWKPSLVRLTNRWWNISLTLFNITHIPENVTIKYALFNNT